VHERGSGIVGIFVVLRRHTWCYMRSTGSVGSDTRVWPHTHGEGCTRRARGREQRATDLRCVEKYRCILRICASRRAISRLYTYTRSGGGTRGSGVRMQRAVRRAQPLWWPEGLISIERARPTHVYKPAEALARGGGVAGRQQQQQHAADVEQALANARAVRGRGCRLLQEDGNGADAGGWLELGRAARRGGDMKLPLWFAHSLAALVAEWRWDWLVGRRRVKKGRSRARIGLKQPSKLLGVDLDSAPVIGVATLVGVTGHSGLRQ
jgi:hypothetical protein